MNPSRHADFHGVVINSLVSAGVEVVLQILVEELEDERKTRLCVDNLKQLDDIRVLKLLENADFSNGCAGSAFVFALETDLLQSDQFLGFPISSLEHETIGAFSDFLKLLVFCKTLLWILPLLELEVRHSRRERSHPSRFE